MIIERFKTLAKRNDSIDWLVQDLLSMGSWTYLVGEAGSGKSMLMIQLVDALQEGKDFLGLKCKQRNCLYIQVDTGKAEWQEQVRRLAGNSFAWTMYSMGDCFLDNSNEVDLVRQIVWGEYDIDSQLYSVLQGNKFDIVVFDVLNKMTSHDINTKQGMNHVLNKLEAITVKGTGENKESVHYILVHHPNATVRRGVNAGSGYKGFGGLCGNMLTLGSNLLVLEKSKVTGKKEIMLDRDANTGAWHLPGDVFSGIDNISDIEKMLGVRI